MGYMGQREHIISLGMYEIDGEVDDRQIIDDDRRQMLIDKDIDGRQMDRQRYIDNRQKDRYIDTCTHRYRQMINQIDGQIDRQIDRQIDGQMRDLVIRGRQGTYSKANLHQNVENLRRTELIFQVFISQIWIQDTLVYYQVSDES